MDTETPGTNDVGHRGGPQVPPGSVAPARWAEVDGYYLERMVRRTPAADVYLAYGPATQSYREVIVVQALPGVDQSALRRAIDLDVFAAGTLRHPDVAPVVDVGYARDGRLYVATARPVGRSLGELLADEGAMSAPRALELAGAIVPVIAAAREVGVVHGWLTPDSVVVVPKQGSQSERVVILGFGTAVAQEGTPTPGGFPGDLYPYMSPERAAGEPASVPGDVFSLGSVILGLLIGGPPPPVRPGATRTEPVVPVAPESVMRVLARARATAPAERFAAVAELGAALGVTGRERPEPLPAKRPRSARVLHEPRPEAAPVGAEDDAVGSALLGSYLHMESPAARRTGSRRGLGMLVAAVGVVAAGGAALVWRNRADPEFPSPPVPVARRLDAPPTPRPVPAAVAPYAQVPAPAATSPLPAAPAPVTPGTAPLTGRAVAVSNAPPSAEIRSAPLATRTTSAPVGVTTPAALPVARPAAVATTPVPRPVATRDAPAADRATERPVDRNTASPSPAGGSTAPTSSAAGEVVAPTPAVTAANTPPSATPPAATGEAAAIEAASRAAGVRAAVAEYATAIEARDIGWLRRVYPGMTEQQRNGWVAFFGSVAGLRTRLAIDEITPAGAGVQVRVRGTYEYQNLRPHRAERLPVSFTATLARDASGWRMRAVQ